jgi:uncharacterized damage-inducible protein DinB
MVAHFEQQVQHRRVRRWPRRPHACSGKGEVGVITSIRDYLKYFDAVNKRDMRDIGALPPEADGWRPINGEGEKAYTINQLVGHIAGQRLYFLAAYMGEGWTESRINALPGSVVRPKRPPIDVGTRDKWLPALQSTADTFAERLAETPDEWLHRKVPSIDSEKSFSGWRLLMMMLEHDISHRSQIDTYAGINDWEPPQIYNRTAERIGELAASQRSDSGEAGPERD